MKKLLISTFFILVIVTCFSQNINIYSSPITSSTSNIVGTIFSSSMISSSPFTRTGANQSLNYTDSGLNVSGAGTGTPTDFIEYSNWYTNLENCTATVTFIPTSDGYGIGIGEVSYPTSGTSAFFSQIVLTGAKKGQLKYNGLSSGSYIEFDSSAIYFPITNGQTYSLSRVRTPDSVYIVINNLTLGTSKTLQHYQDYGPTYGKGEKCGRIAVCFYGGSQRILSMSYSSNIGKNPKMLFLGDSNMQGFFALTNSARYTQKLKAYYRDSLVVDAGASNTSADIVNLIPEILLIKPKSVFINIGTNGITSADIDTIKNTMLRNSITVYLSTIFPNASGVVSNNSIIRAQHGVILIDFDSTLLNGGSVLYPAYDADGNVHLTPAGNTAVYNQLLTEFNQFLTPR